MHIQNAFRLFTLLFLGLITYSPIASKPIITLFLQPYPLAAVNGNELGQSLTQPGKIADACLFGLEYEQVAGIIGLYNGYCTVSNAYGQLAFTRDQEDPELTLLITQKIVPVMMLGFNIHHWEITPSAPAQAYACQRKYDSNVDAYYWDIRAKELPDNNHIPVDTIILLAQPKQIYVPQGIQFTEKTVNFMLPDIYVKEGIKKAKNTLYFLSLKHFFSKSEFIYKDKEKVRLRHIKP